ncbi:hypothetical protein OG322_07600 [Streptomyces sp. NBC_01260]|uniref:hypothetical protein n=1 Tax=unclassified Streptomyces TaxID=2593676 RepID=UPI000F4A87C1|nr:MULTISPECIES: hypothetical protein [unclassified Streptomyces]MCX4769284.1 hypothetical protein [Streptomyces sp. NBC_01285]ROQ76563.1 hypothetical protein EDD95_3022 [Streptomyces sp. CEV 2-1]
MVQKPESDIEPRERRIDLSLPQVAGSAVAAVAAAVAASQLGVYGTILGAGVMSIVATCGGSVFQHFFRRTGEQIREVTVQVKHPDREVTVHTRQKRDAGDADGTWGTPETRIALREAEGSADAAAVPRAMDATTVLRRVDAATAPEEADATTVLRAVDATTVLRRATDDPGRTQLIKSLDGTRPLATAPGAGDDEFSQATTHGTRIRGWKRSALGAAVVFVVAMAGITTFELVSGNDLSGGQGTTVGSVVRGESGSAPAGPTPSDSTDPGQDRPAPGQDNGTAPGTDPGSGGQSRSPEPGRGDGSTADPTPTPTPTPSDSAGDGSVAPPPPTPSDGTGTGSTPAPSGSAPAQENAPTGTDAGQ